MPFNQQSAITRLTDEAPLTDAELRDLVPLARALPTSIRDNLQTELVLRQLLALKRQEELATRQLESFAKFDESTARANCWMIGFTAAVTFMTLGYARDRFVSTGALGRITDRGLVERWTRR
jgi:hypothetical protein